MNVRLNYTIFIAKIATIGLKLLGKNGSTWPGHIALHLDRHFIRHVLQHKPIKIVLIAGTNGKTTTSKLLRQVLEDNGQKVFQNAEGANLLNGVASSLIKHVSVTGKLPYDYAIWEIDENSLPLVLEQITPEAIIILNLFRDQLDRYGEVNIIADKWHKALLSHLYHKKAPTQLFINGDDPQLRYIAIDGNPQEVHFFGAPTELLAKKQLTHDVDSVYCPVCGHKLTYEAVAYSHLGIFHCKQCSFTNKGEGKNAVTRFQKSELTSSLKGTYNYYNSAAVMLVAQKLLSLSPKVIQKSLHSFQAAFGRQEMITYKGRKVFLLLSKNPAGFNQSISVVKEFNKCNVMVILNDRIPDGRDVSWIWDVEFNELINTSGHIVVSGDRTYDMALRLYYCLDNPEKINKDHFVKTAQLTIQDDLVKALEYAVSVTKENEPLIILPTYSAMLEVRQLLIGKKLL